MEIYGKSFEINDKPNWLYHPDYPYRILIIGGSGSGKTNVLLNINDQILTKFIHKSNIHLNKSTSYLSLKEKKIGTKNLKIQRYSLNIYKQLMMFKKI